MKEVVVVWVLVPGGIAVLGELLPVPQASTPSALALDVRMRWPIPTRFASSSSARVATTLT